MARLILNALAQAGFEPHLASQLRTLDSAGDPGKQERLRDAGEAVAAELAARYSGEAPFQRPRLWFTYHVYYKAPDWIGPKVAQALGIPYVIAEGSRAGKRASGPWALGHLGAERALDAADAIFVMTQQDREALSRARPARQTLVDFPPFLDPSDWACPARSGSAGAPRLLTVAMMREGDKLASYRILADALFRLLDRKWRLDVVGDGPARPEVEELFRPLGERIVLHGAVDDKARLCHFYAQADVFLWPAVNEAYGMALLEAQAAGCPVVAGAYGGVPSVVMSGRTGILAAPGDPARFADAVADLLADPPARLTMAEAAARFVREERSAAVAALRLRDALVPLISMKSGA